MERVAVVGTSGSGKSTLTRALADALGCPLLELDAVFHQPGWTELEQAEFRARVGDFVAGERWVTDGNYGAVQDLIWARADTVVWLDYPRSLVMRRIIRRTLRRMIRREELWNGNRERWRNLASLDPERSIIAWAWTQHPVDRERYAGAASDPANTDLSVLRLSTPAQADDLVRRVLRTRGTAPPG